VKSGNLCWGQRYIWLRHHHMPSYARHEAHIIRSFDLPDGIRLATVRSTLNYLVRRHEALRTTFHIDSDTDPHQRVHPPGAVPLTVVSVERDGTAPPAETIDTLDLNGGAATISTGATFTAFTVHPMGGTIGGSGVFARSSNSWRASRARLSSRALSVRSAGIELKLPCAHER